jgi:hypothetical protein
MFRKENIFKKVLNVFLVKYVWKKQFDKMWLSLRLIISCIDGLLTSVNKAWTLEASYFEHCSLAIAVVSVTTNLAICTRGDDKILMLLQKWLLVAHLKITWKPVTFRSVKFQPWAVLGWSWESYLVHIHALILLFQIKTDESTHVYMLLKRHFTRINTI